MRVHIKCTEKNAYSIHMLYEYNYLQEIKEKMKSCMFIMLTYLFKKSKHLCYFSMKNECLKLAVNLTITIFPTVQK